MKRNGFAFLPVIIIIVVLGVAGYLAYQSPQLKSTITNKLTASSSPLVKDQATPTPPNEPTITTSQNGNTYTSNALGIEFDYSTHVYGDKTIKSQVFEQGNKIYVYPSTIKEPTQGQSIEVFPKDPNDSLEVAITKKFLSGISKEDCFVVIKSDSATPNIVKATISYPWTNPDEPKFLFGEKCPEKYKESNGISYFQMDTKHPSTFIYLSIGQAPGPALSDLLNSPQWFESIRILK